MKRGSAGTHIGRDFTEAVDSVGGGDAGNRAPCKYVSRLKGSALCVRVYCTTIVVQRRTRDELY